MLWHSGVPLERCLTDFASRPGGWNGKGLSPRRPAGRSARGKENSSREERPCPRWPLTPGPERSPRSGRSGRDSRCVGAGGRTALGQEQGVSVSPCVPERGRFWVSSFSPRSSALLFFFPPSFCVFCPYAQGVVPRAAGAWRSPRPQPPPLTSVQCP